MGGENSRRAAGRTEEFLPVFRSSLEFKLQLVPLCNQRPSVAQRAA
jgi:hypothetical protein